MGFTAPRRFFHAVDSVPAPPLSARFLLTFAATLSLSVLGFGPLVTAARAQDCAQPSVEGCFVESGHSVSAALTDPEAAHLWRLVLSEAGDLRVVLSGLAADYRLYVYAPDGTLTTSDRPGLAEEVVEFAGAEPGYYEIFVDSPRGQASDNPYHLLVQVHGASPGGPGPRTPDSSPVSRPVPSAPNPAPVPPTAGRPGVGERQGLRATVFEVVRPYAYRGSTRAGWEYALIRMRFDNVSDHGWTLTRGRTEVQMEGGEIVRGGAGVLTGSITRLDAYVAPGGSVEADDLVQLRAGQPITQVRVIFSTGTPPVPVVDVPLQ